VSDIVFHLFCFFTSEKQSIIYRFIWTPQ